LAFAERAVTGVGNRTGSSNWRAGGRGNSMGSGGKDLEGQAAAATAAALALLGGEGSTQTLTDRQCLEEFGVTVELRSSLALAGIIKQGLLASRGEKDRGGEGDEDPAKAAVCLMVLRWVLMEGGSDAGMCAAEVRV
ncbi:unnamed protein product, partial [Choristocarpus tenellus]